MGRSITSFIFGLFITAILIELILIIGLGKAVQYLQYKKITSELKMNIDRLDSYIQNEEESPTLLLASELLTSAISISPEKDFETKRLAIAESGLLISEYCILKFQDESAMASKRREWIFEASNAYAISSIHQFVSLKTNQKNMIKELNLLYEGTDNLYNWTKTSNEVLKLLGEEVPRLRVKFNNSKF